MQAHQRSHVQAVVATALQNLDEARRAALGQTPTGSRLTPLPDAERARLVGRLDHIAATLRELLSAVAPDLAQRTAPRGVGETRMWVRLLLGNLRETLQDLDPERISARYGRLEAEIAEVLNQAVRELLSQVERAQP